jgi:hypothetical protein
MLSQLVIHSALVCNVVRRAKLRFIYIYREREIRPSDFNDFVDFVDVYDPTITYTRHPIRYLLHMFEYNPTHLLKVGFQYMHRVRYVVHELCHKTKLQILQCVFELGADECM